VRRPPFLIDASSDVSGHAYLTSSSHDEVAQESDRIGGSFFTHYLVTGLRGAADVSDDKRVTLDEAYQFAFSETLAQTESTLSGPQHAVYEIDLTGTGDLVLTDLRATDASIVLDSELNGRVYIHESATGQLAAELGKVAGREVEVDLAPGTYHVKVVAHRGSAGSGSDPAATDDRVDTEPLLEGTIELKSGGHERIAPDGLKVAELEATTGRGGPRIIDDGAREPGAATDPANDPTAAQRDDGAEDIALPSPMPGDVRYEHLALHIGLVPGVGMNGWMRETDAPIRNDLALHLLLGGTDSVHGASLGTLAAWVHEDVLGTQLSGGVAVAGRVSGLQGAGIGNVAESVDGFQGAGVFNHADVIDGAQLSGVYGVSESVRGFQGAAVAAVAGDVSGAQAGVVTVGDHIGGAQIGIVNVADDVDGAQIGLINVARESDASIGLFNFVDGGIFSPTIWASETAFANVGLRLGGKHFYTLFSVGSQSPFVEPLKDAKTGQPRYDFVGEWGFAVGGRFYPMDASEAMHVDIDLQTSQMFTDEGYHPPVVLERLRLAAGYKFHEHFGLYGGASFNVLVELLRDVVPVNYTGVKPVTVQDRSTTDDVRVALFPGFFAGLEF